MNFAKHVILAVVVILLLLDFLKASDIQTDTGATNITTPCKEGRRYCKNGGVCVEKGNDFFCDCLEGTEGKTCDVVRDCQVPGKYAQCKGGKGTCIYVVPEKEAKCYCPYNKKLNDEKGYCEDECAERGKECKNDGLCVVGAYDVYCRCYRGTEGKNCDIVRDCEVKGKYAGCKGENGTCYYSVPEREAKCFCPINKKLNEKKGYCE